MISVLLRANFGEILTWFRWNHALKTSYEGAKKAVWTLQNCHLIVQNGVKIC